MIVRTNIHSYRKRRRWIISALVLYSAILVYWMFIGFGREVHIGGALQYNLMPLRTVGLYFDLENGLSLRSRMVNLLGNVAVFVPFGIVLPLLRKNLRTPVGLALIMAPSILLLECLQMLLHVGSFDVDDLLLNLLGVWTGYGLLRLGEHKGNR